MKSPSSVERERRVRRVWKVDEIRRIVDQVRENPFRHPPRRAIDLIEHVLDGNLVGLNEGWRRRR